MLFHSIVHLSCTPEFFWEVLTQKSRYTCSDNLNFKGWQTNNQIYYKGYGDSFKGKILQVKQKHLLNFLRYDKTSERDMIARYCFQMKYSSFGVVVILSVETFRQMPGLVQCYQDEVTKHLKELASLSQGYWLLSTHLPNPLGDNSPLHQ
ncbi:MAG: hypothetical protein EOO93_28060 [Pedobacter sp.]|nr:MAG: hypothetical protein EOO93_28060 [Pedobacter sp.]